MPIRIDSRKWNNQFKVVNEVMTFSTYCFLNIDSKCLQVLQKNTKDHHYVYLYKYLKYFLIFKVCRRGRQAVDLSVWIYISLVKVSSYCSLILLWFADSFLIPISRLLYLCYIHYLSVIQHVSKGQCMFTEWTTHNLEYCPFLSCMFTKSFSCGFVEIRSQVEQICLELAM